jgi:hypothetical protein
VLSLRADRVLDVTYATGGVCAGAQHQFTRRKQDAVCVQGGDYKRPKPATQPCACTAADVECDYGYVAGANGTCSQLPRVSVPGSLLPETVFDFLGFFSVGIKEPSE